MRRSSRAFLEMQLLHLRLIVARLYLAEGCSASLIKLDSVITAVLLTVHSGFVSCAGAQLQSDSPEFWRDAFCLRQAAGAGGLACPAFMAPLAADVLAAGKARVLLRHGAAAAVAALHDAAQAGSVAAAGARGPAAGRQYSAAPAATRLAGECQRRLRAAQLALLRCRTPEDRGDGGRAAVAGESQHRLAGRLAQAAAAVCISPAMAALKEERQWDVAAAACGDEHAQLQLTQSAPAEAAASDLPASGWSLSQAVPGEHPLPLPPLLPAALPGPASAQRRPPAAPAAPGRAGEQEEVKDTLQHACMDELLRVCVLEPVRVQV